ncbi:MAG: hypothetical protein O3A50_05340 [Planctomycetota bacterium]|nr:hypothetical protein [Planctomycetota bacterium]
MLSKRCAGLLLADQQDWEVTIRNPWFGDVHDYWYSLFENHSGHPDEAKPNAVSNEFAKFSPQ